MRHLDANIIAAAHARIDPVFLNSPLLQQTGLDAALGVALALKVESLNPIRSFKGRGTALFVSGLADRRPLVCASAGNFGQGVARAGRARGIPVTVFAATTANPLKIEAMRALGAEVKLIGEDFDAAKTASRAFCADNQGTFVEDGDHPAIAEGAGTIAWEMTGAGLDPEVVLIPMGNGALATGMGAWLKHARPGARIVAVVASGAPAMLASFNAGRAVASPQSNTIADGIAVREPVPYAVECMKTTIDEVIAVDDKAIIAAMRLIHTQLGLVIEPAGVAGIAALLAHPERLRGQRVATVLCGGNVTPAQARDWLL